MPQEKVDSKLKEIKQWLHIFLIVLGLAIILSMLIVINELMGLEFTLYSLFFSVIAAIAIVFLKKQKKNQKPYLHSNRGNIEID